MQGRGLAQHAWKQQRRPQKYGAVAVVTDEGRFASQREHQRYCVLKLMQRAGQISNLERQVSFSFDLNGHHIGKYVADFVYFEGGARVAEDSKGVETAAYRLKRQLMLAFYGITIRET
jgi:hypothetical protein